ncbi:aspartate-alanine antiporter [Scandinavium sp. H11S7]|uniref:Aspartate-alanine antiporter n=1 Tax=Scandinavium hiltneri TaxID=2926519 RepID=A0ABT2E258_9ENTR|nr:aspartate-alanine antiporter [Scandinavium hiltneri]MCS2159368.1 aspartate-alanine antiporter [Scandinavium hiltneri]MCS2161959.1 aspartate-alanine antiporter [Scandinavium hiltneri]
MNWLHDLFQKSPEIALFFSIAAGYYIGKIKFGKFQLGGVAGSLLVAVLVSQVGVQIDPEVKSVMFALFIYAVGYESGPDFFRSLGKQSIKEIVLAVVLAVTGLLTVVVLARWFDLDKGLAAGVAAGALTQSAIIGTAGDAITKLGLGADEVQRLQGNVAIGYAVTYVFGSFGAILVCVNLLPKFMGRSIKEDALKAENEIQAGANVFGPGQEAAAPDLVGRIFKLPASTATSVQALENNTEVPITIERVKRDKQILEPSPDMQLLPGDIVLVVGRRNAVVSVADKLGKEMHDEEGMELTMQRRDVVITNKTLDKRAFGEIRAEVAHDVRHGVYVSQISRQGKILPLEPETQLLLGDMVTVFGAENDVKRVVDLVGHAIVPSAKTDFVYMGAGLVVGLLVGMLTAKIGSIPLTLGSGGGALLSGLLFGWFRSRRQSFGYMPSGAVQILKDLGLAAFVVVVGISSGLQAVQTVESQGLKLLIIGVVVTILPLILTMLFGRYVLRYNNTAIFAGALSGTRSANPAFGEILDKAENSVPTVPFAITYALANVFLTLLGPLVIALV